MKTKTDKFPALRCEDLLGSFGRCCKEVRVPCMNFPRYHQCTRKAVAVEACGPVCKQHTTEAQDARKQKTLLAENRRREKFFAYVRAKQARPNTDQQP